MGRDPGREAGAVAAALDDAGNESGAVELAHLFGHADVLVDQRLVVRDHVLVRRLGARRLLERVGRLGEQVPPQHRRDELEQRDDVQWPRLRARRLAIQQEVKELEADGVALDVQSFPRAMVSLVAAMSRAWWAGKVGGVRNLSYLFSRSWMPVTRFCA